MQSFLALLEYKCRTTAIRKQFRKHCKEPFADGGRLCNQHELNYFVWRRTSEKTPSAELAASYRKSVRMDTYYICGFYWSRELPANYNIMSRFRSSSRVDGVLRSHNQIKPLYFDSTKMRCSVSSFTFCEMISPKLLRAGGRTGRRALNTNCQ